MPFIDLNETVGDGRSARKTRNTVTLSAGMANGNVQTRITISEDIGSKIGLAKGTRVDLQKGTGNDSGRLRLVPNPNGTYTVQTRVGSKQFFVMTNKLARVPMRSKKLNIVGDTNELVLELGEIA
jgi:hypothetical protein